MRVTILTLSGRVTLGEESNQLRNTIKAALGKGKTRLVLDLGEISYIDSAEQAVKSFNQSVR